MKYILDGEQMRSADQYTIRELGVPSLFLMENAAKVCVKAITTYSEGKRVCVVCGSGNNGGDGFAISRLLLEKGYDVTTCLVGNPDKTTVETSVQIKRLEAMDHRILYGYESGNFDVIVDAIFGVGLSRDIKGSYAEVIETLNKEKGMKFAVDIPSGISSELGQVLGIAFQADYTVTFQFAKVGQLLYPGKTYCGKLIVEDIGIVSDSILKRNDVCYTHDKEEISHLLPKRKEDSNKGTFGRLLIVAGCKGMSGACYLNAYAAYTAGAGLVRIYTEESNRVILQQLLPEAIVTTYEEFEEKQLDDCLQWADTLCIGSGLGTSQVSKDILSYVLNHYKKPSVIDADALNMISEDSSLMNQLSHIPCVLTPHMKEMSRLLGISISELKNNRIKLVQDFTDKYSTICVLKDAKTFVFEKDCGPYLNLSGNQSMAKGGSGDVLCGLIGGLLAQSKKLKAAAVSGVYLHGRAGDLAKEEKGSYSVLARDLINYFIKAIKEEERMKNENL